jgi:hypothetical protein
MTRPFFFFYEHHRIAAIALEVLSPPLHFWRTPTDHRYGCSTGILPIRDHGPDRSDSSVTRICRNEGDGGGIRSRDRRMAEMWQARGDPLDRSWGRSFFEFFFCFSRRSRRTPAASRAEEEAKAPSFHTCTLPDGPRAARSGRRRTTKTEMKSRAF